jgi:flagellin
MLSIQTNVNSLVAQQNLSVNTKFQSQTIQQLTSGYRINSSADDAAGLAVANKFRSGVAELTQGVANGNDAVAQLQIMDGGMNNISQILDRLKTLATQSASGTFTGDRTILDQEFQTDVAEIDRQAQSIGLNTGGIFAKSLSVYLGQGSGSSSLANAEVGVNLSSATVDSQSLGLKGMQAVVGSADLGAASATSVASVLANSTNSQNGTVTSTQFLLSGPGFSQNGLPLSVSVNLNGVATIEDLVTNINTAIQGVANGSTAADAALKNAGIVASVHTDANGGKQLAFTSSTTAFQVQSGDQMANALMGDFSSGTTGATLSATVTGSAYDSAGTMAAGQLNVTISGAGMATPVNIDTTYGSATSITTVISDLKSAVAGNTALKAAGITMDTVGGQVVFTDSKGSQFQVDVAGDVKNQLGLGAFASSGTTNADYNSITAGTAYSSAGNTGVDQTATMEISVGGGPSISLGSIALDQGNASAASVTSGTLSPTTVATGVPATAARYTAGAAIGSTYTPQDYTTTFGDINVTVGTTTKDIQLAGNDQTFAQLKADLQSALDDGTNGFGDGTALSSGIQVGDDGHGKITLTSLNPGTTSDITVAAGTTHDAAAALGFNGSDAAVNGTAGSGNSIVQFSVDGHQISFNLTADTAATSAVAAGSTAVGTSFTTKSFLSAATASVYTAANMGTAAGHDFTTNGDINVTFGGVQKNITLTTDDGTLAAMETDLQTALDDGTTGFGDGSLHSSGITVGDDGNGHITLTSVATGSGNDISVAAGTSADASAILGFDPAGDVAVNGADPTAQPHNIQVTLDGTTKTVQLTGISGGSQDTSFADLKTDLQAGLDATTAFGDGTAGSSGITVGDDGHGNITLTTVAKGATETISLAAGATNDGLADIGFTAGPGVSGTAATTTSLASMADQINTAIAAAKTDPAGSLYGTGSSATASVVGGAIQIANDNKGADHSIGGLTSGTGYFGDSSTWGSATLTNSTSGVAYGFNRDAASLVDAINQQIAANSTLEQNGFQASLSGNNLVISAKTGVNFRVNGGAASATATVVGSKDLTAGADFSLAPMTLNVKIDGTAHSVTLNQNYTDETQLLNAINTQLPGNYASMTSLNGKNYLAFTSPTSGTGGSVQVLSTGTANAALGLTDTTAHSGANEVDTGFGVSNWSSAGNLAVTAASSSLNVSDAAGSAQTGGLSFVDMTSGTQALTVTANNASGAMQATTITLSASNGTGADIDAAVNAINQQLQQTNNATLKSIVAVKQNVGGAEEINFLSPGTAFQVSLGTATSGTGLNGGVAENVSSSIVGAGSTIAIDTQDGATAAVAALSAAVAKLGSAQAVVGKGQNQLGYAINLAQSQITNFSAAEAQIRDADVAAEAANLTKAQVLQQASIAAMAQANSAPQAVLTLLRG